MLQAARFGDEISHTSQRSGIIAGVLIGALIVGAAAAAVVSGGTAVPFMIGLGAVLIGAGAGGAIGRWIGSDLTPKGAINKGAATVRINGMAAARSCIDTALCQDHTLQLIAKGSLNVFVEGFPIARISDIGACSFTISKGSPNVFIGEATGACPGIEITPEIEPWLEMLPTILGVAGSYCLGFGALGWAGSALSTGLGFGGSLIGEDLGNKYIGGRWGGLIGGILGGFLGGAFGAGISRGLGNAGIRGFNLAVGLRIPPSRVATNTDEAFFWSGRTNGVGGDKVAGEIARNNGGKTLEMLIEERGIKMPDWDPTNPASMRA